MAKTSPSRKESDRTAGHFKKCDDADAVEEEKKAAEEHADESAGDDDGQEGGDVKMAAVETADDAGVNGPSAEGKSNDDCDNASEHDDEQDDDEETKMIARMAAAIQRAEQQLAARTPSPIIYQGAPVALARSPTTLLPPTHPSYTGDITPSHPLVSLS